MPSLPSYIETANIADRNLRFAWDDSNTQVVEGETDDGLVERLSLFTQRANVAYATALTGWVLGRFQTFSGLENAYHYFEAGWATAIDLRYCRVVWEDFPHSEKWEDAVKGPVWLAMRRLQQTIGSLVEEGDPEYTASKLWQIACHVMPSPEALGKLEAWNRMILTRMERLPPRVASDLLGDVVPVEFFDTTFDVFLADTEAIVDQHLKALSPVANPFLNTPERMIEEGFIGIPYTFNLALDRERRVLR